MLPSVISISFFTITTYGSESFETLKWRAKSYFP